jgi:competence protein ComFC
MKNYLLSLIDLILPPRCAVCKNYSSQALCNGCASKIELVGSDICEICGRPRDKYFLSSICSDCSKERPVFKKARSAAIYRGVTKNAIHHYKFNGVRGLSSPLSELLVTAVKNSDLPLKEIDMVIPVPLSAKRQAKRGFNQTFALANCLSGAFGIPLDLIFLKKVKDVRPQFELKREERFENIKGAFCASKNVEGKSIVLVDDIFTTGATACEASRSLLAAGAKDIYVVTLARAIE